MQDTGTAIFQTTTDSQVAFQILDAASAQIFNFETTRPDLASVAPNVFSITVNGNVGFPGTGNAIRFLEVRGRISSGTQSNRVRGVDSIVAFEGTAVLTGAQMARGFNANVTWNSTGTATSVVGIQNFMACGGGSGVTTGLVTESIANRALIGYNTNDGGSVTDGTGYLFAAPRNVDANHTITNLYGFRTEDLGATGVTNSWGLFIPDQTSPGVAIETGAGPVIFGGRVQTNKGSDVASADEITLGDANYFDITGTTTINHINKTGWQAGSSAVLQFDASLTVTHNAGSPTGTEASILLETAGNFSATADDLLLLWFDGTVFRGKPVVI